MGDTFFSSCSTTKLSLVNHRRHYVANVEHPLRIIFTLVFIIIIMSYHQRGSPWPSPATLLFRPSLPVGLQRYILYRHRVVLAGRPAFARPCEGVHKSMSLMSSSLFLQQWPACLARLTWIVFVMCSKWPYSCCFVGCCLQDLFNITHSILV